jgi:predicted nucleic acid-binding Zn ribbon protein
VSVLGWDVERWLRQPPTVDEARPATCPACAAPSRPVGQPLGLHGHGTRDRQGWGVAREDADPEIHVVPVRRYECQRCGVTVTVLPEAMARRYLYLATTIAAALWRWGRKREPAREVRRALSPLRVVGESTAKRWPSLFRWTAQRVRLWPEVARSVCGSAPVRVQAGQLATALAAWSDAPFTVAQATEAAVRRGAAKRLAV